MGCCEQQNCGCSDPISATTVGATGATGPAGPPANSALYDNVGTANANATVLEESLDDYTLPASGSGLPTLSTNGDYLEIVDYFSVKASTGTHTFIIKYGAVELIRQNITAGTSTSIKVRSYIYRVSSAAQGYNVEFEWADGDKWQGKIVKPLAALANDLTLATIIDAKVIAVNIGDITHKGKVVTLFKKAS